MEVQVDFLGTVVALKLVLIWNVFSYDGFRSGSKLFILKVRLIGTHAFEQYTLFVKAQHAYLYCF